MKFLIIARHAGEPGSGGSRRPSLMARTLQDQGHEVCVVSPFDVPGVKTVLRVPLEAEALDQDDPTQIGRVERPATGLKSIPRRLLPEKAMAYLREWAEFPDVDIHWSRRVQEKLLSQTLHFDWVITTSPPESTHLIGRSIADHCGARWCAELRDSWIEDSHRAIVKGLRAKAESWLARKHLARADALVVVDHFIAEEARALTRSTRPIHILPHYSEPWSGEAGVDFGTNALDLLHSGAFQLSDRRRDLGFVLDTLDALSEARIADGSKPLRLHLAGRLSDEESALVSARSPERMAVIAHGLLSLEDSRKLQSKVDGLLLYVPESSRVLPGKYAEYALSGKPVFLLGPDRVRKLAATPSLMESVSAIKSATLGQAGPIDEAYDAKFVIARFVEALTDIT